MHNLSYENEFSFTCKLKTHSHIMKGYAPGLALKKRHKTTQKRPIPAVPPSVPKWEGGKQT